MKLFRIIAPAVLLLSLAAAGGELFWNGRPLPIHYADAINFPVYRWPRTLLSYPVRFAPGTDLAKLVLKDAAGKPVPVQWSQVMAESATLNFFGDLPSGAERNFTLEAGTPASAPKFDAIQLRLPEARGFAPGETVPGPFAGLRIGDGGWIGESVIKSPKLAVKSLKRATLENGPLFRTEQLSYEFANGGVYRVTLRIVAGYDFFDFDEEMENLPVDAGIRMTARWTGFPVEYRFATESSYWNEAAGTWPKIDEPMISAMIQEDPHWSPTVVEQPGEPMYMKLGPYCGNGVREIFPCASFWSEKGNELGIFVRDYNRWFDPAYGIWQPTRNLMVGFRYRDGVLEWSFPLTTGGRSLAVNYAPAAKGEKFVEALKRDYWKNVPKPAGDVRFNYRTTRFRYNQLLGQLYGPQSLNRVKDWQLTYDGKHPDPGPLDGRKYKDAADMEKFVLNSSLVFYPQGLNTWPGVNSIQHRYMYGMLSESYLRFAEELSPESRRRLDAQLLYAGYLLTDDAMHPIRSSLAGCPNMAADGWTMPMHVAYLFPEHPMAKEWRDYFQKYWQVSTVFFTRPAVKAYGSRGGRWTESFGVYNWAHLAPTLPAQIAGFLSDGVNRWATPATAERGNWMVDSVTAPVLNPDPYWRQNFRSGEAIPPPLTEARARRNYPAQGAHGSGTTMPIPQTVRYFGWFLRNYAPLTAEHLLWLDAEEFQEVAGSTDWGKSHLAPRIGGNRGTRPELASSKYTGYGVNLRHGVGTPDEVFLYLSQVDDGPNYRWGNSGQGATGALYYVAGGRLWTGHEREDAGDHTANDVDGYSGAAVMKEHAFRALGRNVLEKPLFDLGVAQLATIESRRGKDAYAWPEYESRSVMLVGGDYFVLLDKVRGNTRFSWFIPKDGEFPDFWFLNPVSIRQDHWREVETPSARGFQRDGTPKNGDHLVLVTHRKGKLKLPTMQKRELPFLKNKLYDFRKTGRYPEGVYPVETPESKDLFFRSTRPLHYQDKQVSFSGSAGVVRDRRDQSLELALFGSGELRSGKLGIRIGSDLAAAGLTRTASGGLSGVISVAGTAPQAVEFDFGGVPGRLHIDGVEADGKAVAPGRHMWEYTAGTAAPARPELLRTENFSGGAKVFFNPAGGADRYRLEISSDNGASWTTAAEGSASPLEVKDLSNGRKVHLRLTALRGNRMSPPSPLYPLYVTDRPPEHPDGLLLEPGDGQVCATWGECLGVTGYRLYRRERGTEVWKLVYSGPDRQFTDRAPGVVPPRRLPGSADNPAPCQGKIWEYAVAAVNGNGEGVKSELRDTDPASWLNWQPPVPLKFRRRSEYTKEPYNPAGAVPPLYYPD